MSQQQKALTLPTKCGQFELIAKPIPTPKPGEVLIKIRAAALNPMDYTVQTLGILVDDYPAVIGVDAAGDVEQVGEGVQGLVKGDRVLVETNPPNDYAGYQQYALAPADLVVKIPEKVSYPEAASIPATFTTAAVGLLSEKPGGAALNPTLDPKVKFTGQPALVIGGSTSVGQFVIQILKYLDFSPIVTYASTKHSDYLKCLGATHVIDRATVSLEDLPSVVRKITPLPFNIVYNTVRGKEARNAGWACLSDGGQMPDPANHEPFPSDSTGPKRTWFVVGLSADFSPSDSFKKDFVPRASPFGKVILKQLEKMLQDGTIVPNRVKVLPNGLAGIVDGLTNMKQGKVSGVKLVVLPQDTP